ncbi:hypothetical protein FEE95_15130 [Maribacter algarum]|uniref:Uncharacterized protein n=1 Tax=Maribacter algarum (ex Zhang et al. 2020) TaxID=2578118 RepID=A0A5S3PNH2_9FLAO|nr:hypothetical protein [Maribacter algarum]TMM55973.1 hypothetical protein FEE95_15130 [Maribacter algarum]
MNPILRNVLAVILGWFGGSLINMGLVRIGSSVMPIPGVDTNDLNALAEAMPTLDFKYFIFPFLAHALGTLVGAALAYRIAANHKMKFAWAIGGLFLLGGIAVNYMLPGPTWFAIADIVLAYLPMAWLGRKIAGKL